MLILSFCSVAMEEEVPLLLHPNEEEMDMGDKPEELLEQLHIQTAEGISSITYQPGLLYSCADIEIQPAPGLTAVKNTFHLTLKRSTKPVITITINNNMVCF